jgi:hypothetical protein
MPMEARSLNRAAMPGSATRWGVQLLIDIAVDAHRADPLDIARPWSEGDTVEHMDDRFVPPVIGRTHRLCRPCCDENCNRERQDKWQESLHLRD